MRSYRELLGCEGTRLCNGSGARRLGAGRGCLATEPAAAASALRPGRQRSAAQRRAGGRRRRPRAAGTPAENLLLADYCLPEGKLPCLLQPTREAGGAEKLGHLASGRERWGYREKWKWGVLWRRGVLLRGVEVNLPFGVTSEEQLRLWASPSQESWRARSSLSHQLSRDGANSRLHHRGGKESWGIITLPSVLDTDSQPCCSLSAVGQVLCFMWGCLVVGFWVFF